MQHSYKVLDGRPEGNKPFGRPLRRWKINIKMDLKEAAVNVWIQLAQDD
jgi:hypothetical protein